jgi:hypothetical protein
MENDMKMQNEGDTTPTRVKNENTCEVCGNQYDKCFEVRKDGETHIFDSFECAIHALAPRCEHCGCMILGHGMETPDHYFCCAHCASVHGVEGFEDRMAEPERNQ